MKLYTYYWYIQTSLCEHCELKDSKIYSTVMGGESLALVQAIVESVEENPNKLQALVKLFVQRDERKNQERVRLVTLLRNKNTIIGI